MRFAMPAWAAKQNEAEKENSAPMSAFSFLNIYLYPIAHSLWYYKLAARSFVIGKIMLCKRKQITQN
jgi:hypothetical protein